MLEENNSDFALSKSEIICVKLTVRFAFRKVNGYFLRTFKVELRIPFGGVDANKIAAGAV